MEPSSDPAVERERLETLVELSQKRVARAGERRDRANLEVTEAFDALDAAKVNLAAWHVANPDPQLSLAGIITEGDAQ